MNFISPKNFKSGRLIANKYTTEDVVILCIGVIISVVLEMVYFSSFLSTNKILNIVVAILLALPAGIVILAVLPFGVYHNVRTFARLILIDIKNPNDYIWGGLKRNANKFEETKETN